jgi:nitrogen fixation NifU-like protein
VPDIIVERYKAPKRKGTIENPDLSCKDDKLSCGDHVQIDLRVDDNNIVTDAMFNGQGCSISIASADLLLEQIIGQPLGKIRTLSKGQFLSSLNLDIPIQREKCVFLAFDILMMCINENSNE